MNTNIIMLGLGILIFSSLSVGVVQGEATVAIELTDTTYRPTSVTIEPGTQVVWTNTASYNHTVTSVDGLFDSGRLLRGQTFEYNFTEPGTYRYICAIHPGRPDPLMHGEIIVNDYANRTRVREHQTGTILWAINNNSDLNFLASAVIASNLSAMLREEGPYTVFAPNDTAFQKLDRETLEGLYDDPDELEAVLRYHVVDGRYTSEDLMNMAELQTLSGDNLTVNATDGSLQVGNATVIVPDINATNGVIHIIDAVLMPENIPENRTPGINVTDQVVVNGTVTIDQALSEGAGWAVIHAAGNSTPGAIIGYSPVEDGTNENVTVEVEIENVTGALFAMLHIDAGEQGVFEFPGPDVPAEIDGEPVVELFNVTDLPGERR